MRQRTIVCPLIQHEGHYLLCKMADDRGVFPGQWALSGGGVASMISALIWSGYRPPIKARPAGIP